MAPYLPSPISPASWSIPLCMLSLLFLSHFHHIFNPNTISSSTVTAALPCVPLPIQVHSIQPPAQTFIFHVSSLCVLTVFLLSSTVKPVFRHKIAPVEINTGNLAKFECETEDAPNVSFKWFKDGQPIKEGDKYRILSRFRTSSLELLSPNREASGQYSCKATNQHGSDECSASLKVTGKSKARFLLLRWFWVCFIL